MLPTHFFSSQNELLMLDRMRGDHLKQKRGPCCMIGRAKEVGSNCGHPSVSTFSPSTNFLESTVNTGGRDVMQAGLRSTVIAMASILILLPQEILPLPGTSKMECQTLRCFSSMAFTGWFSLLTT